MRPCTAKHHAFTGLLLASFALKAQPPTHYRQIASAGVTIGGHTLTPDTTITAVALNDRGEVAFAAQWFDGTSAPPHLGDGAIFASGHIVAHRGETIDGNYIAVFGDAIAINNAGQVAFLAWCTHSLEELTHDAFTYPCIFLDRHSIALPSAPPTAKAPQFTLTDEGKIIIKDESKPAVPRASPEVKKKPGLLDRVHITPPVLKGIPIKVDATSKAKDQNKPHPSSEVTQRPVFAPNIPFAYNRSGQILLPINLYPAGSCCC